MNLFRKETLDANRPRMHGEIVVRSDWVWWTLTAAVVVFVAGMLVLIFFGEYTRRAAVSGYLIPTAGVVRIYSAQAGRAAIVHVVEGEAVLSGQPLVTVIDERIDSGGRDARGRGADQVRARQENYKSVIRQQRNLFAQTQQGLTLRTETLRQEMSQLLSEHKTQAQRIMFASATHKRWQELLTKNYVSENAVQEKQELVIEQEARLQALQRAYTGLRRELESSQSELAALPMRERTQIADLERGVGLAQQELIEINGRRELVVTAPQAGRISGLTVKPSQVVNTERPLMMVLPFELSGNSMTAVSTAGTAQESALEAHLFAQSKDAGFVRKGQEVLIRYSAYPYQKFGHYKGLVIEVSRTPLMPAELPFPVSAKTDASALASLAGLSGLAGAASSLGADPVFRIRVRLGDQVAKAYGIAQPLQSGMQLDADVMLDTRTIAEWIMEPLYSLRGKYFE